MPHNFSGKTALITGSSSGIGLAIARKFYQEGYKVVINGRDQDRLQMVIDQLPGVFAIQADVTKPFEVNNLVSLTLKEFGSIDALVCNVGSGSSVPPGVENFEEWGRVFDINFRSTTNMVESARDALGKTRGSIVCISSICGCEVIENAPLTYSAAKAALNMYVRGVARPLAKLGIRINAVAPGNILHHNSVWNMKIKKNAGDVTAYLKEKVPLNCFGTPNDIADLVLYLSSDKSKFVTGAIWRLDGGQGHL